ncbi:MAG: hypothetical protein K2N41_10030 [Lachnospiraceae bacterium]|nr:hypothetical protein [Lachnospiraceae bacterium]MDE7240031.1 hypothetical protein [Lachnospiraceae bacterium]
MKRFRIYASILTCLLIFSGCGKTQQAPASSSDTSLSSDDVLSSDDAVSFDDTLSSNDTSSPDELLPSEETLSPAELAMEAYSSFLSGDISLFDSEQLYTWHLEGWADFLQSDLTYEYTYLDLDGDGIEELLIQMEDAPLCYNAVFHYADGALFCWNQDMVEMTSGDYPLQDGTMVSQYDYNDTSSYTVFRYLPNGERETLSQLYARESVDEDSDLPCPYYEVGGIEVDHDVFEEQLEEMITKQLLPRSDWTSIDRTD